METIFWIGIGVGFAMSLLGWLLRWQYLRRSTQYHQEQESYVHESMASDFPRLMALALAALTRLSVACFLAIAMLVLLAAMRGEHRLGVGLTGVLAPDVVEALEILTIALMSGAICVCCLVIADQARRILRAC